MGVLSRYCEESLAEAVATLIWVAPRLSADVQELNEVPTIVHCVYNGLVQLHRELMHIS